MIRRMLQFDIMPLADGGWTVTRPDGDPLVPDASLSMDDACKLAAWATALSEASPAVVDDITAELANLDDELARLRAAWWS